MVWTTLGHPVTVYAMSNQALIADLDHWARKDAHIDPKTFNCRFYEECNASVGGKLDHGNNCMMSFVGREFGVNGTFRLVVVGMDHGDPEGGSFEDRRAGIEDWYQKGGCKFNPHYKGVVKTAAVFFGSAGDYCRRMCGTSCQKSREPSLACVIDRIAQPNIVKCTPDKDTQINRESRATMTMLWNCTHHLIHELLILRPQLIVFHGAKSRWPVTTKLQSRGIVLKSIESITDRHGPVLYDWPTLGAHLLFLHHPSRGGLDRQWDAVVACSFRAWAAASRLASPRSRASSSAL